MNEKDFISVLKSRRSIRKFSNESIPEEDINTIITAASWAPSGSNQQNWHFMVIKSDSVKQNILDAINNKIGQISKKINSQSALKAFSNYAKFFNFFNEAPLLVAVIKKPYQSLIKTLIDRYAENEYISSSDVQGPAAAVQNMILMAHNLGYGSCWMTGPLIAKIELENLLEIKSPDELIALVPIGRPAEIPHSTKRKSLDSIITYI